MGWGAFGGEGAGRGQTNEYITHPLKGSGAGPRMRNHEYMSCSFFFFSFFFFFLFFHCSVGRDFIIQTLYLQKKKLSLVFFGFVISRFQ